MKLIMDAAKMVVDSRFSGRDSWDEMKEAIAVLADAIDHDKSIAMEAINDGGPAYPRGVNQYMNQPQIGMSLRMSLRMCLAKAAMQGMMANPECNAMGWSDIARSAFEMADEMLAMGKEGA